jgi:hypothetical protein
MPTTGFVTLRLRHRLSSPFCWYVADKTVLFCGNISVKIGNAVVKQTLFSYKNNISSQNPLQT